jgi:glycosyltransferase involved in cell wall biosynthesis
MGRVKTAVLINHTAEMGGAEFALIRLIASMDRTKWQPVVVFGADGPAADRLRKMSVETYVLPLGEALRSTKKDSLTQKGLFSLRRWVGLTGYSLRLSRFLKERAADVVHTNSMKAHVLGGIAARLAGVPLVWHVRDSIERSYLPVAAVKAMQLLAARLPDKIVAVSENIAQSILGENWKSRAKVIYDGLEPAAFENPSSPAETPEWKIGIVGRLTPWKGQHVFIEAAAALLSKGYPVSFEILGSALFGEEKYATGLHRQIATLGVGSRIQFRGFVSDVGKRMRKWDLCVHASTSPDPCPNVVLEAMAAGVPVVGSNGGGVPELLDRGRCGELYTMGNSAELANAMERLLLNRERRATISLCARERAMALFRSDRVWAEVEEIWDSLAEPQTWKKRSWPWIEDGLGLSRERANPVENPIGASSAAMEPVLMHDKGIVSEIYTNCPK